MELDGTYLILLAHGGGFDPVGVLTFSQGMLEGSDNRGFRIEGTYEKLAEQMIRYCVVIHVPAETKQADGVPVPGAMAHHLRFDLRPTDGGNFEKEIELPGLGVARCRLERLEPTA